MTETPDSTGPARRTTDVHLAAVPDAPRGSRWMDLLRHGFASRSGDLVSGWLFTGSELVLIGSVLVAELALLLSSPPWAADLGRRPWLGIPMLLLLLVPLALSPDRVRRHRLTILAGSFVAFALAALGGRVVLQPVVAVALGLRTSRLDDSPMRFVMLGGLLLTSVVGVAVRAGAAASLSPEAVGPLAWMTGIFFLTGYAMAFFDIGVATARRAQTIATQLRTTNRRLERINAELHDLALRDPLTGIANRRAFDQVAARMWERAQLEGVPAAVLWLDVDAFKKYNDRYGHDAGDVVLTQVAAALSSTFQRNDDLVARVGGEEFAVLLVGCSREDAQRQAARGLVAVRRLDIEHLEGRAKQRVTVSIGLWSGVPKPSVKFAEVAKRADDALYAAKQLGGHRVVSADAVARLRQPSMRDRTTPLPFDPDMSYDEPTVIVPLGPGAGGTPVRRMMKTGEFKRPKR